ncbi:helix-turn-helix transcriptional regulator [Agromyces neolithicus]|uniref:HTH cro/C1-type domain-containing protein n=1 Tax=Agromyces neolithicus TaxID=269420 RepID=A0ABN2M1J9_9MICO
MLVNDLAELGDLIRRRRTSLGLSQTELAEQVGSTRQWVSRLEKGKNDISTARLFAVLDALELNLDLRPPTNARSPESSRMASHSMLPTEVLHALATARPTPVPFPRSTSEMLDLASRKLNESGIGLTEGEREKPDAQP